MYILLITYSIVSLITYFVKLLSEFEQYGDTIVLL